MTYGLESKMVLKPLPRMAPEQVAAYRSAIAPLQAAAKASKATRLKVFTWLKPGLSPSISPCST